MTKRFSDRIEAGQQLAAKLHHLCGADTVVVALPRGGVPVAFPVARALRAPLDILAVRKLGIPFQPEVAMGAIGEGGVRVVDEAIVGTAGVSPAEFAAVEASERVELDRQIRRFRDDRPPIPLNGRTVIIVDDGIATGSTARAACLVARAHGAARVVVAVPVASAQAFSDLKSVADKLVCLTTLAPAYSVGQWYEDFSPTSDAEVVGLLARARATSTTDTEVLANAIVATDPADRDDEVTIDAGAVRLEGHFAVPEPAVGIVVFVHGSGSSRHSPRNRSVAISLHRLGFGTLLFDLLTPEEELDRARVFDVGLLSERLRYGLTWLDRQPEAQGIGVGLFGASTGAAAALSVAAEPGSDIGAVVSRGGRPDLAGERLAAVRAPTLLIVGGNDHVVIELNRRALVELTCEHQMEIVSGATHLFEEPGAMARVAELAGDWFIGHLVTA